MDSEQPPESEVDTEDLVLDFDELMKYSLILLRSNYSHPEIPRNLKWFLNLSFKHILYNIYMLLLVFSLFSIQDIKSNIIDACGIATLLVVYGVINFKYFVLLKYRDAFNLLIEGVKKSYVVADTLPKEERRVVEKYALLGRRVTQYWVCMSGCSSMCFIGIPLSMTIYNYLKGTPRNVSIVDMAYPKFILDVINEDLLFWIVFVIFVFYIYMGTCMYTGLVPLGPIFILSTCAQLDILKIRVSKLFPADGSITNEQRALMFRQIAIGLQDVYDFVENMNVALKVLYELTLKGTSLIIPVVAYVLLEALRQRQIRPEFVTLFFGAFLICSMPCYYGDKLIEKSSDLQDAVYSSGWETVYEKKTRTTLLIFMTRLQRTVAIRTIFVTVCLEALADVMNQAYALFNLLYAALG